ncbi:MAG: type II toxin-antitoxin system RelE/ParE family toxin [Dehalococcoidia bacterium]|nr:type II toxin-antitoxin system RelE/ParE family toxin [Dehalococcoidia bacterium]
MYEIRVASSRVEKELARIPMGSRKGIIDQIRKLAENPRPSSIKALAFNVYRLRVGPCRVIYKVYDNEKIVLIGRLARRSERTYRNWEKLF